MLNKSEVMMLIKEAGLNAQFRENSKNHWGDGVKKISEVEAALRYRKNITANCGLGY